MPVQSVQFIAEDYLPGVTTPAVYTVPAGFEAVITDATIVSTSAGRNVASITLITPAISFGVLAIDELGQVQAQWTGRFVIPAGSTFSYSVNSVTSDMSVAVAGYLYS